MRGQVSVVRFDVFSKISLPTGHRRLDPSSKKGHDPDLIWRVVLQQHVLHNQWQEAMQVAVRELGARDVKAVEDLRIAYLREQGKWMILEKPDGSRVRVYPTWDEQPS